MGSGGIQLMATYIQLRNNVGYAVVNSHGEPDHSVTPDHTTVVEIESDNPDSYLRKKYDPITKNWSDAEIIVWAEISPNGSIMQIKNTYFSHEVAGPLVTPDVEPHWKWLNNEWVRPITPDEVLAAQTLAQEKEDALRLVNGPQPSSNPAPTN